MSVSHSKSPKNQSNTPKAPRPLAFFLSLVIALLALSISSLLYESASNELGDVQKLVDTHADQINLRNDAKKRLDELNTIHTNLIAEYKQKGKVVDWSFHTFRQLKDDREKAIQAHQGYATVSEQSGFEHALELAKEKQSARLSLGLWCMFSILLPVLFLYLPFYRAHHSRYKGSTLKTQAISLLLSLPFLNAINYLYLSATWNLDGVQRKNAFIVTMPICLAFLFCQGLCVYHFRSTPQLSLYSMAVCCVLWAVVHFRFYQMENYRFKNLSKMHY